MISVLVHAFAATVVAAVFGAALGAVGGVLGAPWGSGGSVIVAMTAAWAFAHEALGAPFPVPQLRRQVPEWWRTFFSPLASSTLYGAALGIGFLTYLLHSTLVVVAVAAFASGRPVHAAVLVAPFGFARGLAALAAVRGPAVVHRLAAFARRRWPLAAVNASAVAAVAVVAGASTHGSVGIRSLALAGVAVAFAWGAAWKALRPRAWGSIVATYDLGRLSPGVKAAVPVAEAAVVGLAVAGARPLAGMVALICVVAFTAAAVRRRASTPGRVPCGCFGASETSFPAIVARNVALALAAAIAAGGVNGLELRAPSPGDVIPLVLALAGVAAVLVAAWSVHRSLSAGRA
jgi:hypothetical protein